MRNRLTWTHFVCAGVMTLRAAGDGVEFEVTLDPQLLIWNHEVRIRVTRGPDDLGIPSMVIAENDVVAPCDKCVGTAKGDPCVWCGGTGRGMLASAQRIVELLYAGYRARVRRGRQGLWTLQAAALPPLSREHWVFDE